MAITDKCAKGGSKGRHPRKSIESVWSYRDRVRKAKADLEFSGKGCEGQQERILQVHKQQKEDH